MECSTPRSLSKWLDKATLTGDDKDMMFRRDSSPCTESIPISARLQAKVFIHRRFLLVNEIIIGLKTRDACKLDVIIQQRTSFKGKMLCRAKRGLIFTASRPQHLRLLNTRVYILYLTLTGVPSALLRASAFTRSV